MRFISGIRAHGFIVLQFFHFFPFNFNAVWFLLFCLKTSTFARTCTGVAWDAKLSHLSPSTQTAACPIRTTALANSLTPLLIQICPQERSLTHLVLLSEAFSCWHTPSPNQPTNQQPNTPAASQHKYMLSFSTTGGHSTLQGTFSQLADARY